MANILRTFVIFLISQILSIQCGEHEALHFTRKIPRSIIDKELNEKFMNPPLIYPTAIACPARPGEEDEFNKNNSFSKNSLFVRKTYEGDKTSQDVDYYTCENPYKMSVLYHKEKVEFEFGFEIYLDKSEYGDKQIVESDRGKYDLITNSLDYKNYFIPYLSYIRNMSFLSHIPMIPTITKYLAQKPKPLYLDGERKKEMGFLWIDSIRMKFDFAAKRVSQATYELSLSTRGLQKCDNYDLGKEFFSGMEMGDLYDKANQERMLRGIKVPLPSTESEGYTDEMACESKSKCFIKWSIVPPELFHHLAIKPTSCSDLLTVPVWKTEIHFLLNKLDNFLYALSMAIGHPVGDITIHSGVHGVLQLPTDTFFASNKPITLTEKGIQVPDVIYKIVRYETKVCHIAKKMLAKNEPKSPESEPVHNDKNDELNGENGSPKSDETDEIKNLPKKPAKTDDKADEKKPAECKLATSSIILIIHNNPSFNPETDQICTDVCREAGWDIIKNHKLNENVAISSSYIYCCSINDPGIRKKLNINYEHELEADYSSVMFSLKAVPMFNYETNTFDLRNAYDLIVNAYEHLFEDAKYEPHEDNRLRTFVANYHIKMGYHQIQEPKNNIDELHIPETQGEEQEGEEKPATEKEELNDEKQDSM